MANLTDDEFTVLMIAEDNSIAPLGRWKEPVLSLAKRGLLERYNEVNYGITLAGKEVRAARDASDEGEMLRLLGRGHEADVPVAVEPPAEEEK